MAENTALLPDEQTEVRKIVSPSSGPDNALLGLLLDNDTQAYILDEVSGETSAVSGVAIADAAGDLILQQEGGEDWTRLTFMSGDAVTFSVASGLQLTITSNATEPPSTIVIDVSADGEASVNDGATSFEESENSNYKNGIGRIKIAEPLSKLQSALGQSRSALSQSERCAGIGNKVLTAIDWACKAKSMVGAKQWGEAGLNAACIAAGEATAAIKDKVPRRLLSALRTSIDISCEYAKKGVGYGSLLTKINPVDAACFTLSRAKDLTGDKLAESLCNMLSSNDDVVRWGLCEGMDGKTTHLGCFLYSEEDGDRNAFCEAKGYNYMQQEYNDRRDDPEGEYAAKPLEECAYVCTTPVSLHEDPQVCDTHSQPFKIWILCTARWEDGGHISSRRYKCFKYTGPGFPYDASWSFHTEARENAKAQCESLGYENEVGGWDARHPAMTDPEAACRNACDVHGADENFPSTCE